MAMNNEKALDVLRLAGDNENKLFWRHVWFFNRENIDEQFNGTSISLSPDFTNGLPIATLHSTVFSFKPDHYKRIREVFNSLAENITLETITTRDQISKDKVKHLNDLLIGYQIGVYEDGGQIFFVGNTENIIKIRQRLGKSPLSFDQILSGICVITDQASPTEQHNEYVQVILTEQMQACVLLHKLFDDRFLKENNVKFEEEKNSFDVKIFVQSKEIGQRVVDKINTLMRSSQYKVVHESVIFNKYVINFICQPQVKEFLNKKINKVSYYPDVIWFRGSDITIEVYAKENLNLDRSVRRLKESVRYTSNPVSPKLFSRKVANDKLLEIEKQYCGKVEISLSPCFSTINLIYTSDNVGIDTKIKFLQRSRPLYIKNDIRSKCKVIFKKIQEEIEQKYPVSLEEKEGSTYDWVIKGLDDDTIRHAEKEIEEITKRISSVTKTCITDESQYVLQEKLVGVQEAFPNCRLEFTETLQGNQNGSFDIDARESVQCRTWNLKTGGYIRVYQKEMCTQHWTFSNSIPVKLVLSSEGINSTIKMKEDFGTHIASIFLPYWTENTNKELEMLATHVTSLFRWTADKKEVASLSFDVSDVDAIKWPMKKAMKAILSLVVNDTQVAPVCFYSKEKAMFEKITKVIEDVMDNYGVAGKPTPLTIKVIKGELARQTTDVIVNSTNKNLQLNQGAVSFSILKLAGNEIQTECTKIIQSQGQLQYGDVVCTEGYKLQCGMVFHGALPGWSDAAQRILEEFIWRCLCEADKRNFRSIAFPAFGTGQLGYPSKTLARVMFDAVKKYFDKRNSFYLNEVNFVIYQKDTLTIRDFEQEQKSRYDKDKADKTWAEEIMQSPVLSICCITIIGEDPKIVQDAFKEVNVVLMKKERKQINKNNSSTFESIPEAPQEQVIDHGGANYREMSSITEQQHEKQSGDDMMQKVLKERDANVDTDKSGQNRQTNPTISFIDVSLHKSTNNPEDKIEISLKKYGVRKKQIIFMDNEDEIYGRVKFYSEEDAISFSKKVQKDTDLKIVERSPDAVINIRAKLANMTIQILKSQKAQDELERRSGVEIHRNEDVPYQLSGDLTSIVAARNLLKDWLNKGVETELSDQEQLNSKTLDEIHEDKDIIIETKRAQNNQHHGQDEQHLSKESTQPQETHETSDFLQGGSVHQNNNSLHEPLFGRTSGAIPKQTNKHIYSGLPDTQPVTESGPMQSKQTSPVNKSNENMYSNLESSVKSGGNNDRSQDQSKKPSDNRHDQFSGSDHGSMHRDHAAPVNKNHDKMYPDLNTPGKSGANYDISQDRSETVSRHEQSPGSNVTRQQEKPSDDSLVLVTKENIKVYVYKADICSLSNIDGIVNSTNEDLKNCFGVSKAIQEAAGQSMVRECHNFIRTHGQLQPGEVCVTTGGNIGKKILHIVAPKWKQGMDKGSFGKDLYSVVKKCLVSAQENDFTSVALPAISSGHGNAPTESIYSAYPSGVLKYSKKSGKKQGLKEIHFVDIKDDIVQKMQWAFLSAVPENDVSLFSKAKDIPAKFKEMLRPNIRGIGFARRNNEYISMDKNACVVVCDGGLMKSVEHGHLDRIKATVGLDSCKNEETGSVLTEDDAFSGKSKSSKKCHERGGGDFKSNYRNAKKAHYKSKSLVHEMFGGDLKFHYAFCVVLPPLTENGKRKDSSEQITFFKTLSNCCHEMLKSAAKCGIKHLAMPVIGPDLYDCSEQWFLKLCVSNMMLSMKSFIDRRKRSKQFMVFHIICDGNDTLYNMVQKEIELWRKPLNETVV